MALVVAQGSTAWNAADAATTTYAIDLSGSGFSAAQPLKALIVFANAQADSTDATASADIQLTIGVATGTAARGCIAMQSDDGDTAGDTNCVERTDCVVTAITIAGADDGRLDISVFGDDDFTFIVDVQTTANKRVHWVAIGGSDITVAQAGNFTFTPDTATTQDVTVTGFVETPTTPDQAVLILTSTSGTGTISAQAQFCVGVAAGISPTNYVAATTARDAADPTDTSSYCLSGEISAVIGASQSVAIRSSVSAWGADKFVFNRIEASATDRTYVYLALKGARFIAGDFTVPTNTTPFSESSFGFPPSAALFFTSGRAADTADTATVHAELSIGAAANTADQRCVSIYDEDAVGTTDCDHSVQYGEVALGWTSGGGSLDFAVALDSFDSDGITMHCTNAAGAGSKFVWYLAIGRAPQALTLTADQGSYSYTGQAVGLTSSRTIAIAQGSYAYTGQDVTLTLGKMLALDQGSYILSGQDLGLTSARSMALDQGAYALTGQDVALAYGRSVTLDQGTYSLSGQDLAFNRGRALGTEQGSYALSGQVIGIAYGRVMALDAGSYLVAGQDVALYYARIPIAACLFGTVPADVVMYGTISASPVASGTVPASPVANGAALADMSLDGTVPASPTLSAEIESC